MRPRHPHRRRRHRALITASALLLLAAVLAGTTGASPVGAASSAGGSISRSEVIDRAHSWFDDDVQYSSRPHKNRYGSYRADCSGYISMAWHLKSSYTTGSLPGISTRLGSKSSLKPGDILLSAGHVVLFVRWDTKDDGRHRYARVWAMATPATDMQSYKNTDLTSGWLRGYTPYRYKKIK